MKWLAFSLLPVLLISGCKTKSEVRREQDVERLKAELKEVKGDRSDYDNLSEELKVELARMNNLLEERASQSRTQLDEVKKEIATLTGKLEKVESKLEATEAAEREARSRSSLPPPAPVQERVRPTYDLGKRLYDEGKFEEAIDILKVVAKTKGKGDEVKKSQFLLAEAYFSNKEFASAALEFSDFKRLYPKDTLIPQAIYRQANAFKSMNKTKEAKLFYQELVERYPKSSLVAKAKVEMKKLR
jgi:TolA-binding protein